MRFPIIGWKKLLKLFGPLLFVIFFIRVVDPAQTANLLKNFMNSPNIFYHFRQSTCQYCLEKRNWDYPSWNFSQAFFPDISREFLWLGGESVPGLARKNGRKVKWHPGNDRDGVGIFSMNGSRAFEIWGSFLREGSPFLGTRLILSHRVFLQRSK